MSKFKVGDKVISLVDVANARTKGKEYKIINIEGMCYYYLDDNGHECFTAMPETFKLAPKEVKVKVHKLVKKKHLGYRVVTNDQVIVETDNDKGILKVDNIKSEILIDLTPHTIESLYEFFRYLKSDLDE